jgi:hypothetical protein
MKTRWRNIGLALKVLPRVLIDPRQRQLFREMRTFIRQLPIVLKAPLPQALQSITPTASTKLNSEQAVREVADVVALLDRASPLGLCLRGSLTRYHFLRELDVPVTLHFGAKLIGGQPDRSITGHAWLMLNDQIYFEDSENYLGFTVMLTYPQSEVKEETK